MRLLVRRSFQEGARIEPHQAAIAALARRQQDDARPLDRRAAGPRAVLLVAEIDRQRAADDRLNASRRHFLGEFERAEHVVGVGERQRRLAVGLCQFGQPRDRERALQQRIGRVHVQVHEAWISHQSQARIPQAGSCGPGRPVYRARTATAVRRNVVSVASVRQDLRSHPRSKNVASDATGGSDHERQSSLETTRELRRQEPRQPQLLSKSTKVPDPRLAASLQNCAELFEQGRAAARPSSAIAATGDAALLRPRNSRLHSFFILSPDGLHKSWRPSGCVLSAAMRCEIHSRNSTILPATARAIRIFRYSRMGTAISI